MERASGAGRGLALLVLTIAVDIVHGFVHVGGARGALIAGEPVRSRSLRAMRPSPMTIMAADPETSVASRRDLLRTVFTAATGAALALPLAASAAPTSLSSMQAPLQDRLAPGHWYRIDRHTHTHA